MPDERDPIDALRAAWRALEAPAADAELDAPDARTEAAVSWMRAAWNALEAPAVPAVPVAAPRARHLFAGGTRRLAFLAAAAALALATLPLLRRGLESESPPEVAVAPRTTRIAALEREDGAIEMRSGPVRLVLLMPDPSPDVPSKAVPSPAVDDGNR